MENQVNRKDYRSVGFPTREPDVERVLDIDNQK